MGLKANGLGSGDNGKCEGGSANKHVWKKEMVALVIASITPKCKVYTRKRWVSSQDIFHITSWRDEIN